MAFLARAATVPFRVAGRAAKGVARGVSRGARSVGRAAKGAAQKASRGARSVGRAGRSARSVASRAKGKVSSARTAVRRINRRQKRSRFNANKQSRSGGRKKRRRDGRERKEKRSGREREDGRRSRRQEADSSRGGAPDQDRTQYRQQQDQTREEYRRGQQGANYRFASPGFLPGVAAGVVIGGATTTTTAFYPQPSPFYGGTEGMDANWRALYYTPQQQQQLPYYPQEQGSSPYSSSTSPPDPLSEAQQRGSDEREEQIQEPAPVAPFSADELKSLALHNAIPHRRIRSLLVIEGLPLLDFIEASNNFIAEPNRRKQIAKGMLMVRMAEKLDLRYGTHAQGWVKAVRNRPSGWSLMHAVRIADALSEEQVAEIAEMDDDKVAAYLTENPTELEETYTEPLPIACKMGSHASSGSIQSLESPDKDRICIFYRRHRKILVFHLNGLVEGYSYVDKKTSKGSNVPHMINVSEVPFLRLSASETRCEHLRLFSQVRALVTLARLIPQAPENVETVSDVVKKPKSTLGSIYSFSSGFEPTSRVYPLLALNLSEEQMKEYRFGVKETSMFNGLVKTMVEAVNSHHAVIDKLFAGARFNVNIGNLK